MEAPDLSFRVGRNEFSVDVLFFPLRFAGNHAAGRAGTADFVQLVPVKYDIRPQQGRECSARRTRYVPFFLCAVFKFNSDAGRFLVGWGRNADFFFIPKRRKALSGKAIKIVARGAEGGRLYGSVTAQEIADELFKQYGVKVEKRRIDVANIRNAGDFTVSVWLYAGITAEMTAKVEVG